MRRVAVLLAAGMVVALGGQALGQPATESVDVTSEEAAPGGEAGRPVISGDGRWVVFSSAARLTPGDVSDAVDVYVRDLVEDKTTLVTPAPATGSGSTTTRRYRTTEGSSPSRRRGAGSFPRT